MNAFHNAPSSINAFGPRGARFLLESHHPRRTFHIVRRARYDIPEFGIRCLGLDT